MPKVVKILLVIVPLFAAFLFRAWFVNCTFVSGEELAQIEDKRAHLAKENVALKKNVSYVSSLSHIREKAQKEGFSALSLEFLEPPSLASR